MKFIIFVLIGFNLITFEIGRRQFEENSRNETVISHLQNMIDVESKSLADSINENTQLHMVIRKQAKLIEHTHFTMNVDCK